MGQASRLPPINGQRLEQLTALLASLGIDPVASGEPTGAGQQQADATALAPIEEALTHTSAGRGRNHEQLEFLGDAVLRLAAAEFLERRHPSLSVGQRSALRAQLVSDRWLAELADRIELAPLLRLGPVALGDASGRATVLAECCEALVGALYRLGGSSRGGLELVLRWLEPAWERSSAELLADPDRHNWKTALQEWSQGRGLGLPHYRCEEMSRRHGDPHRFRAWVHCGCESPATGVVLCTGEGWGGSRREAEQQAARVALAAIRRPEGWSGER
jgi:ribonuclease III